MSAGKPNKTTAAKAGAKGATKAGGKRTARRVVKPAAKVTWFVGKKIAKRKASKHARRYGDAARTAWSAALIYGPMAGEVLGITEPPRPRRAFPTFLAGIVIGAGAAVLLAGRNRTS